MSTTALPWRAFFSAAAAFNFVAGLGLMLVPNAVYTIADTVPPSSLETRLMGWLIAALGIGYAVVAKDPSHNRGIVQAGLIGKLGAVMLVWSHWLTGHAPTAFALAIVGDVIFAVGFVIFLRRTQP